MSFCFPLDDIANSTFLVYADNRYISKEAFGPGTQRLVEVSSGGAFALDVDIA